MCLAIPARVEAVDTVAGTALVRRDGRLSTVSLAMLEPEEVPTVGDYVVVQYGYAMERMSEADALATRRAIEDLQAGLDPSAFEEVFESGGVEP